MCLLEVIDLIDKKGKVSKKFFGFDGFEKKEDLIFNYYTFDFDLIQKRDFEIKEIFKRFLKENNYYKFVKKNFSQSQLNILPSNVAEKIIEKYRNNSHPDIYEINSKLIDAYMARGFGNF